MGLLANTARQKVWLVLVAVVVLSGVADAPNTANALGVVVGGLIIYYVPILLYNLVISDATESSEQDAEAV